MDNRRFRWAVFGATLLLAFSGGCSRTYTPADLTIANGPDPESLDPAAFTASGDLRIIEGLFEGVTRSNSETGATEPGLAESWTVSDGGLTITFRLRENLAWSTGEPISAEDVVYSWRRVLDPAAGCRYASLLYSVKGGEDFSNGVTDDPASIGIRALDPLHVSVELLNPTAYFAALCSFPALAVVPSQSIELHGDRWVMEYPVPVSGPFQLEHWGLNDRIRLKRNPRYWENSKTRLEVVDLITCSASAALNLYETGVAQVIWDQSLLPAQLIGELRKRRDFHSFDKNGTYLVRFNTTKPPLDNPLVRRALALAVDKQGIVNRIVGGGESVATTLVPSGIANYTSPPGPKMDLEMARRLLGEAGYPDGAGLDPLEILYHESSSGGQNEGIAEELRESWSKQLGITTRLRRMEKSVFLSTQNSLEFDMSLGNWQGDYNDATTFLDVFLSNNGNSRTGWTNAIYDRMLSDASMERDVETRAELLAAAETYLVNEGVPMFPIYFYSGFNYFDPERIGGIWGNIQNRHPLRSIYLK